MPFEAFPCAPFFRGQLPGMLSNVFFPKVASLLTYFFFPHVLKLMALTTEERTCPPHVHLYDKEALNLHRTAGRDARKKGTIWRGRMLHSPVKGGDVLSTGERTPQKIK